MKKVLYIILLSLFVIFPVGVLAEGYVSVSPSSLTIEQGSSKTFTISTYNVIGDVSIRSNNSGIASVSASEWGTGMVGEKESKSGTITVTGVSVGTTTITLNIDAATFDAEDLSGQVRTITVNVVAKPTPQPSPSPTPSQQPVQPEQPQPSQPNNPVNNLSRNNNLKALSVDGYQLVKVDNNNYTLSVSNDVTSINVDAKAEDGKAKVTGNGLHQLNVGENNIEVVVTSEAGDQNKIIIKVTRKDGYYLDDLATVLNNDKIQDINIIINKDSKISKEDIVKIKDSKKTVKFNYYDEDKKLVYSWAINGKKIKDADEFVTTVTSTTEKIKEIYKLSNYADGLYINFEGKLLSGSKIKIYVGDKFENQSNVNVYYYNDNAKTLNLVSSKLKVTDGYIEFTVKDGTKYFATMSNVTAVQKDDSSVNIFMILAIVEFVIIVGLVLVYLLILKPSNKNNVSASAQQQTTVINDTDLL